MYGGFKRNVYSEAWFLLKTQNMGVDEDNVFSTWNNLWKLPIPLKDKNFLWKCARSTIPVKEVLKQKHVQIGGGCPLCTCAFETTEYLFCSCEVACQAWGESDVLQWKTLSEFMHSVLSSPDGRRRLCGANGCYFMGFMACA